MGTAVPHVLSYGNTTHACIWLVNGHITLMTPSRAVIPQRHPDFLPPVISSQGTFSLEDPSLQEFVLCTILFLLNEIPQIVLYLTLICTCSLSQPCMLPDKLRELSCSLKPIPCEPFST